LLLNAPGEQQQGQHLYEEQKLLRELHHSVAVADKSLFVTNPMV